MKVYIVTYSLEYEGTWIAGVFSSISKAKKCVKNIKSESYSEYDYVGYKAYEVD